MEVGTFHTVECETVPGLGGRMGFQSRKSVCDCPPNKKNSKVIQ
jgi:hypothetical protein